MVSIAPKAAPHPSHVLPAILRTSQRLVAANRVLRATIAFHWSSERISQKLTIFAREGSTAQEVLAWTGNHALQEPTATGLACMRRNSVRIVIPECTAMEGISQRRPILVPLDIIVLQVSEEKELCLNLFKYVLVLRETTSLAKLNAVIMSKL